MSDPTGKGRLEAHFGSQAGAYERNVVPRFVPLARRLIELARLAPGQRVLDVAAGTGLAAFMAAEEVGPSGQVLATDLAAGMLEIGRQQAEERGVSNIAFRQMDAEEIDLPERSFDSAICALGLFLIRQAPKAAADIRRLLVPGGRFTCSVWGPPEGHEPFAVFFGQYAKYDPRMTAPAMGRPGVLARLLEEAGYVDVQIRREVDVQSFAGPEAFWEFFMSVGGPSAMFARLPVEQRERFKGDVLGALAAKTGPGGLALRSEIVYGTGIRGT